MARDGEHGRRGRAYAATAGAALVALVLAAPLFGQSGPPEPACPPTAPTPPLVLSGTGTGVVGYLSQAGGPARPECGGGALTPVRRLAGWVRVERPDGTLVHRERVRHHRVFRIALPPGDYVVTGRVTRQPGARARCGALAPDATFDQIEADVHVGDAGWTGLVCSSPVP
jgi:hypothetical protein